MPKKAISITLDDSNLLWLKGRARVIAGGNLSAAVDQLIAEARAGRLGAAETPRSVAGTIAVPDHLVSPPAAGDLHGVLQAAVTRRVDAGEKPVAVSRSKSKRKKP